MFPGKSRSSHPFSVSRDDLPGGVRSDLQGRLDVVDRDDLVALSGKPREEPTFPS